jgi:hypothetical protein
MNHSQQSRIYRLAASGFTKREIVNLTGCAPADVPMMTPKEELASTARRLLVRVPSWWKSGTAAWEHCVKMNFADVL